MMNGKFFGFPSPRYRWRLWLGVGLVEKPWLLLFVGYVFASSMLLGSVCDANDNAKRLYDDLLRNNGYNKLIRPVGNSSDTLIVRLGIRLSQIIDIDEKNQIMTTNVWLRQTWTDLYLRWDPREYGNISTFEVPSEDIWLPETVLFNNADGNYQVTLMTKATLHPDGQVVWEPPAIYKSSCIIDVEFFPYDVQSCKMKFGSWTYDGDQVDLVHICQPKAKTGDIIKKGIDLRGFYPSVEWDILEVEAQKNTRSYPCCTETYPDITFTMTMRRKTLFHTVNLIIPCVAISFLTVLVFYLPSDSGEKVTLCISILLSLTVFFLLLAEIIPPTSIVVPLIGKYLLFTMILVTLSIIVTVVVLNVHFRSPATHSMSPWVRRVFLSILPRLLIMPRPYPEGEPAQGQGQGQEGGDDNKPKKYMVRTCNGIEMRQHPHQDHPGNNHDLSFSGGNGRPPPPPSVGYAYAQPCYQPHPQYSPGSQHEALPCEAGARLLRGGRSAEELQDPYSSSSPVTLRRTRGGGGGGGGGVGGGGVVEGCAAGMMPGMLQTSPTNYSKEVMDAIDSVSFIAEHLKKEDKDSSLPSLWRRRYPVIIEDWKYVAMVLDRLFLWIFTTACFVGTFGIILQAPTLYDYREPLSGMEHADSCHSPTAAIKQ